jgi:phosphopantothenoylcysteine decarboxylase/phosphopantothenate--cysteine ligase
MRFLITCGPSYEPIDEVRRLTNFSTGRLGIFLTNHFQKQGHEVTCLIGEGRTCCDLIQSNLVQTFTTTSDLYHRLEKLTSIQYDAIFHAAALSDYQIEHACDKDKNPLRYHKIPSNLDEVWLKLKTATKILPKLSTLFPHSKIIGWKYELEGTRKEALAEAFDQIKKCKTTACVLNGRAIGDGFIVCDFNQKIDEIKTLAELADYLLKMI